MKEDELRHLDRDGNRSKWEAALVRYIGLIDQNRQKWKNCEDEFVVAFKAVHPRKIRLLRTVPGNGSTERQDEYHDSRDTGIPRCPERGALMLSRWYETFACCSPFSLLLLFLLLLFFFLLAFSSH